MLCGTAHAAPAPGGLYCDHDHRTKALNIFAVKVLADGRLRFGISKWDAKGQNISVFGTAARRGGGWDYRDGMHGPADHRCRILIRTLANGWLLKGDPVARCEFYGGYGTEIGTVRIRKSTRVGPVGHALDDIGAFNEDPHC